MHELNIIIQSITLNVLNLMAWSWQYFERKYLSLLHYFTQQLCQALKAKILVPGKIE
jgi:hypothetical protein